MERVRPTGDVQVTLADAAPGNPPVLTQWFYSGRKTGFQFLYPNNEEHQLQQTKVQTITARPANSAQVDAGE